MHYDNALFSASAHEATAKSNSDIYNANTYKDDELKVSRGYNLVEVGFKKSDPGLSGKSKLANSVIRPYLSVHTSTHLVKEIILIAARCPSNTKIQANIQILI